MHRRMLLPIAGAAVLASLLAFSTPGDAVGTYEANDGGDWRTFPWTHNPTRDAYGHPNTWFYLAGTNVNDQRTLQKLTGNTTALDDHQGVNAFFRPSTSAGAFGFPVVAYNGTGSQQVIAGVANYYPGDVVLHPSPTQAAVIGWRSGINATVCWETIADDMDPAGDGVAVRMVKDNRELLRAALMNDSVHWHWRGSVTVGTNLYIWVDADQGTRVPGNNSGDSTRVGIYIYLC